MVPPPPRNLNSLRAILMHSDDFQAAFVTVLMGEMGLVTLDKSLGPVDDPRRNLHIPTKS